MRGPKHLLNQVYTGESKGVEAYQKRVEDLDPASQNLVMGLMEEDSEHLRRFEARVEEERRES